jgi:hypothetical protein
MSFASPPNPAIPSPFVTDPAASAATNVPWPTLSRTSAVPVRGVNVVGFLAALSGALTSAPVSTTAIVTELAARCTQSGAALPARRIARIRLAVSAAAQMSLTGHPLRRPRHETAIPSAADDRGPSGPFFEATKRCATLAGL